MQTKQRDVRRSVSIIVSRGWLQLRFSYGGKRHYISVGLRDTPTNRKIAEAKAKLIESDLSTGQKLQNLEELLQLLFQVQNNVS